MVDRIGRKWKGGGKERKKEISMLVTEPSRRIDLNSRQRAEEKERRRKKRKGRTSEKTSKREERKRDRERRRNEKRMRRSSNSNTSKPSALISSQFRSLETRTEVVVAWNAAEPGERRRGWSSIEQRTEDSSSCACSIRFHTARSGVRKNSMHNLGEPRWAWCSAEEGGRGGCREGMGWKPTGV